MAYEGKCGSCENFEDSKKNELYDSSNAYNVRGFCTWYGSYYYPDESCSTHYRKRSNSSSSDCYITTILCNRLGLEDDCEELETLRGFRKNILQKDEQYKNILFEYDTVGPVIANKIEQEDILIVRGLYLTYIEPVVDFIKKNNQQEAIDRYTEMTNLLKSFYGLNQEQIIPDDYDATRGGHGKLVKRMK